MNKAHNMGPYGCNSNDSRLTIPGHPELSTVQKLEVEMKNFGNKNLKYNSIDSIIFQHFYLGEIHRYWTKNVPSVNHGYLPFLLNLRGI